MHIELLQKLGLAKNEARIYETLLEAGTAGVGQISVKSKVHRRNVYDSLNRLMEKGLVTETIQSKENIYTAVEPRKLVAILKEKEDELLRALPDLENLYTNTARNQEVFTYRGVEGWKNYLNDILSLGGDVYVLGGKAQLIDPRLATVMTDFRKKITAKGITFHTLYDAEVRGTGHAGFLGEEYHFLPADHSTSCTTTVLADRSVIYSGSSIGSFDDDIRFTIIVDPAIAASYQKNWELIWNACHERLGKPIAG